MIAYNVEIVTPIRELKLQDVSYLRCPGLDGSFGIMNNHREGIFALSVGEIKVSHDGKMKPTPLEEGLLKFIMIL